MNYQSLIIGHITLDTNIDHLDNEVKIPGGAVVYSSASAYALGHNVAVLTKIAPDDNKLLDAFTLPKENVIVLNSKETTYMYNKYFTPDKERRDCKCFSRGDEITADDIPQDVSADIYHFAGLIYGDFSGEMVKELSKKGKVAVDVQGFLRHRNDNDNSLFFEDWADKKEILPYIDFLKTDAAEAEILTGLTDRKEAAKLLFEWGAKEILITHNTEVLAYDGKDFYTCPIKSRNLSGRTGRGDTTFAAYINERCHNGIESSLLTATATVSLKVETPGALKATRADVENYINEFFKEQI
ncbi:MAG: ribokinase [Clostridia bacterium]|nr:ribokinase [Clostridia bacterium]